MTRNRTARILRYGLEGVAAWLFFGFCRLLPLDAASAMGGFLGRHIGPRYKAHRIARRNLELLFPQMPEAEKRQILLKMWDNLGRVLCEYPHLPREAMSRRIRIEGQEHIRAAQASGRPLLFLSGHFGNWEIGPKSAFIFGLPLMLAYRPPNNPLVDTLIHYVRRSYYAGMYAKGSLAARGLLKALKRGQALGILIDQKLNSGIKVPFAGLPAMTSPLPAEFMLHYNAMILPTRVIRTQGAHFITRILPPPVFTRTEDIQADVTAITAQLNDLLAQWLREQPEQWFLVHKRWTNEHYDDL
jgi:KDO2-lipid IV(A) lauroyltransferase